MIKVGLLGGTFNPPHYAHLWMGYYAMQALDLAYVHYLPSVPWQKTTTALHHRVCMLELALAEYQYPPHNQRIALNLCEVKRHQRTQLPNYTIDTLKTLKNELAQTFACSPKEIALYYLIGADQYLNLPTWQAWQSLRDYAHICVLPRPGATLNASTSTSAAISAVKNQATLLEQHVNMPYASCATHGDFLYLSPDVDVQSQSSRRWFMDFLQAVQFQLLFNHSFKFNIDDADVDVDDKNALITLYQTFANTSSTKIRALVHQHAKALTQHCIETIETIENIENIENIEQQQALVDLQQLLPRRVLEYALVHQLY